MVIVYKVLYLLYLQSPANFCIASVDKIGVDDRDIFLLLLLNF